eukprot:scaffold53361_cov58-Phaeocystis_antarctica.AAC.1
MVTQVGAGEEEGATAVFHCRQLPVELAEPLRSFPVVSAVEGPRLLLIEQHLSFRPLHFPIRHRSRPSNQPRIVLWARGTVRALWLDAPPVHHKLATAVAQEGTVVRLLLRLEPIHGGDGVLSGLFGAVSTKKNVPRVPSAIDTCKVEAVAVALHILGEALRALLELLPEDSRSRFLNLQGFAASLPKGVPVLQGASRSLDRGLWRQGQERHAQWQHRALRKLGGPNRQLSEKKAKGGTGDGSKAATRVQPGHT